MSAAERSQSAAAGKLELNISSFQPFATLGLLALIYLSNPIKPSDVKNLIFHFIGCRTI
ncbi:hypothetical protein CKA32_000538 [Geitlerinema sp. FC II]|nr:hypothetical protein CKA32_000538 [Geitlerinema sp. FC II]